VQTRDAIDIARQIARAIEAAHEKGIVHRDLKPANVKVKADGTVKVLDFGVAKALLDDDAADPTATDDTTREVAIVGTPGYMSPEQARGQTVSSATDIWAFGCVLFEMLAGVKAFQGATTADVAAEVLRGEPPWASLARETPASLRTLIKCCLENDAKNRLRHIGDARIFLDAAVIESGSLAGGTARSSRRRPAWLVPVAVCGLATATFIAGLAVARLRTPSELQPAIRVPMAPTSGLMPSLGFGPSLMAGRSCTWWRAAPRLC
jgi:serine/threonine protein kinase